MLNKEEIRSFALTLGFEDTGFTGPEPFHEQKKILKDRMKGYAWAMGRIGSPEAEKKLQGLLPEADPLVAQEIRNALDIFNI